MTFSADVHFDTYSVDIPVERRAQLDAALEHARQTPGQRFFALIFGHADRLEAGVLSADALALARGQAVAKLIQAAGYTPDRMHVESKADRQPVYAPPDPRNSRVEIELVACHSNC